MYRYDNFLGILLASLFPLVFAGVAQPGQTPKGEPQRRTHIFNVGDPEVAGSKTPLSETPAPGTWCVKAISPALWRRVMSYGARKRDSPGSIATSGIGHVGLKVSDLETSVEFYRNILGLDSRASGLGVARIPSGRDTLVLHEKGLGTSGFHFGFRVDSSSTVDEWQAWLRARNTIIYEDVTEEKYRSIKIRDPDGYLIEIFCDERAISE